MSEIRYIPPAVTPTPGTTINPTNLFLPYRSNATTFLDSCLSQTSATQLQTIFAGINNGLSLQTSTNSYLFGYISGGTNCFLEVNGTSRIIRYNDTGNPNGINVNFASNLYQFGKLTGTTTYINVQAGQLSCIYSSAANGLFFNFSSKLYQFGQLSGATTTKLVIDDTGQQINGEHNGVAKGLICNYSSRNYSLGENATNNRTLIGVADSVSRISTSFAGFQNGLSLNGGVGVSFYVFGQITTANRNQFVVDDALQQIYTSRNGSKTGLSIDTNLCVIGSLTLGNQLGIGTNDSSASFVFNGTNITSASAGGNAGHIKILINGTPYRIPYQNP
jgi:hypothetical protein